MSKTIQLITDSKKQKTWNWSKLGTTKSLSLFFFSFFWKDNRTQDCDPF